MDRKGGGSLSPPREENAGKRGKRYKCPKMRRGPLIAKGEVSSSRNSDNYQKKGRLRERGDYRERESITPLRGMTSFVYRKSSWGTRLNLD